MTVDKDALKTMVLAYQTEKERTQEADAIKRKKQQAKEEKTLEQRRIRQKAKTIARLHRDMGTELFLLFVPIVSHEGLQVDISVDATLALTLMYYPTKKSGTDWVLNVYRNGDCVGSTSAYSNDLKNTILAVLAKYWEYVT